MPAVDLYDRYKRGISDNTELYCKDYLDVKQKVAGSSAIYKGKPVEFLYQPMFFTKADIERFEELSAVMTGILNKVTNEYIKNPVFRKLFGFPKAVEELILADPGYEMKFPAARYDIFYDYSGSFQFCELNSDGTSSMNESRVLHEIFSESMAIKNIMGEYDFSDFELFDSWIDSVLENYKEFRGGAYELPSVAIADFKGEGIKSEFEIFRQRFERRRCSTCICDPRDLVYKNGRLFYGDKVIDLVYRRATTARIADEAHSIKDFLDAYREHAVCVVGGFTSQVIHNKVLFAVLHLDDKLSFLTDDEKAFIKRHVPWTALYEPGNTGQKNMLRKNRDEFILKPCDRYAAHGVFMGKNYQDEEWEGILNSISGEAYVIQKLCRIPCMDMVTASEGKLHFEKYNYITGLFMYNGKFAGIYSRAGRKGIIASIAESYTLPNFVRAG